MSLAPFGFKRLVLGLQPPAAHASMRFAAEFAELIDAELFALYIEDASLSHFAEMPFARAIRPHGGAWRRIELAELRLSLDLAAASAERAFVEAARRHARPEFQVVRAAAAEALASTLRAGDIVVMRAATPGERVAEPYASLIAAAFRSAAAVMLTPAEPRAARGPIAAIAVAPDDPVIAVAAAIANAAHETLAVIELNPNAPGSLSLARRGGPLGAEPPAGRFGASGLPALIARLACRLAVASRAAVSIDAAIALAAASGAPVLSLKARQA